MLSNELKDLVQRAVTDGYEEARKRVPQFTDQIFLWVHENKAQEAFTAFLASFVDKAVVSAFEYITENCGKGEEDGTDN